MDESEVHRELELKGPISPTEPGDWERQGSSPISLHDVLDDLELKTTNLLRGEREWRVTKLLLKEGSELPRELAHAQPHYRRRNQALKVYHLTNEPLRSQITT